MLSPLSPFFALALILAALFVATLLSRVTRAEVVAHRYEALDGLRGYLAFFVVIHHAALWHAFARGEGWGSTPSNLYNQLGQGSVAMFFMITGFLFFGKLLRAEKKPIDWLELYTSRFLRIVPLYAFAVLLLLVLVALLSRFELQVPLPTLLEEVVRWFSFDFLGRPDINGVADTFTITAGVTWSLAYEWFFYFSLPLLAALLRRPVPFLWAIGSLLLVALLVWGPSWNAAFEQSRYFLSGMLAAVIAHKTSFSRVAGSSLFAVVASLCIVLAASFFRSAYMLGPFLLFSAAFIIFASGNTLFGLLTLKPAKLLGEISYSIYLLHGLLLYLVLGMIVGPARVAELTVLEYWLVVLGCVPVLITFCLLTFRTIEAPAMSHVPWLTSRMRRVFRRPVPMGKRVIQQQ